MFAALLLYPSVSERLFQLFSYQKLGPNELWLEDDYATSALTGWWIFFAVLAGVGIMIIPIGLPVWLWCEIYSVRCCYAAEHDLGPEALYEDLSQSNILPYIQKLLFCQLKT